MRILALLAALAASAVTVIALSAFTPPATKQTAQATLLPPAPPPVVEAPKPVVVIPPRPEMPVHIVRMRVTACSPDDPKDKAYYAANGYEGNVYGIAADTRCFPRGTFMRVPGYLAKSFPDQWWEVDSAGGSVIRRSSRKGIDHIDVKLRYHSSAVKWGSQWLNVEVIYATELEAWYAECARWDARYAR